MKHIVVCVIAVLLVGCSSKPKTCSDKETTDIVSEIIAGEVIKYFKHGVSDDMTLAEFAAATPAQIRRAFRVENAHATSFDEAVKRYECAGVVSIYLYSADRNWKGGNAGEKKIDIAFTTQRLESGEEYVEVGVPNEVYRFKEALYQEVKKDR